MNIDMHMFDQLDTWWSDTYVDQYPQANVDHLIGKIVSDD